MNHHSDDQRQQTDKEECFALVRRYARLLNRIEADAYDVSISRIIFTMLAGINYKTDPDGYVEAIGAAAEVLLELRQCLVMPPEDCQHPREEKIT